MHLVLDRRALVIDGQGPDDKQLIPENVDQNPGGLPEEEVHEPHDPIGSHLKPPSEGLVGWSIVATAVVGIILVLIALL